MDIIDSWFLNAIAYGGGAGAVFFVLFQFLGKTWLENKFSQRLNYLRHQQDIEVARLRVEIDAMLNGALRLQEKEFEILPRVWELIDKSFLQTRFVTLPFISHADIDKMNDDEIDDLLKLTKFTESQKKAIKSSSSKSGLYFEYLRFERVQDALESSTELGNYLALNGILMPVDLKEKLIRVSITLSNITNRIRTNIVHKIPDQTEYSNQLEELRPLIEEIEGLIQKRLSSHAKSFNDKL